MTMTIAWADFPTLFVNIRLSCVVRGVLTDYPSILQTTLPATASPYTWLIPTSVSALWPFLCLIRVLAATDASGTFFGTSRVTSAITFRGMLVAERGKERV
jgi:hypothetical protein